MDEQTRATLNQINRDFYTTTAIDFDATRGRAWVGWEQLLTAINLPIDSVLDVGCGNGRFGVFMADHQTQALSYHGADNNPKLLDFAQKTLADYPHISANLTEQDAILGNLPDGEYDLVVLFGVIHHVPGYEQRQAFMRNLAQRVKPNGYLAFAAWRFYEQDRFKKRIVAWDEDVAVEKHDYLLDWRRGERALRYCHYVDDAEHTDLVQATELDLIADYRADGSTNDLNRYSVLRRL
jgi:tRNA (uracil-5-)-methyltransferase TRM9